MFTYYAFRSNLLFPRYYVETVSGLPLLRVELPRHWNGRRVGRIQRRMGATAALNLPETPRAGIVSRLVSTRDLWQRSAADAALAELSRQKIPLARATVGIAAQRLSAPVWEAMEQLSDRVQALTLRLPDAERAGLYLQLRNGVPIREGAGDVTLCFFPAAPEPGLLLLGEEQPAPPGLALTVPGLTPPEGCPAERFYAALLEAGRLQQPVEVVGTAPALPPGPRLSLQQDSPASF